MKTKFDISEIIILIILFFTFVVRLNLPFVASLNHFISYIQIALFIAFLIVKLDFNKIFEFKFSKSNLIESLILLSLLIFLISVFVINVATTVNIVTLTKLCSYFIVVICFFYYLPKIFFFDEEKFLKFTWILFYFSLFFIATGLFFFVLDINPVLEYSKMATGLFVHPNTTSMFLTIAIPVIIYKYFTGKLSFTVFSVIIALALINVLFTFSRAGYIGVGVGLLIYTFNKSKKLFILIAIVISIVASTIALEFAAMKTDSSLTRILLIFVSINMITENQTAFLWGYGPINAYEVFQTEKFFFGDEAVIDPHNLFLLLAIQFGVLFTALITIAYFSMLFSVLKLRWKKIISQDDHKFNLAVTIVIALFFQNMLEDMIVYPEVFFMPIFLIFSGFLYYYYKFKESLPKKVI